MILRILVAFFALASAGHLFANFTVEEQSDALLVTPTISFTEAVVTIGGPDGLQQLRFGQNEPIQIPFLALEGRYQYEVVLTPQLTPVQQQAALASRNGTGPEFVIDPATTRFNSHFAVLGGALQMTDIVELASLGGGNNTAGSDDDNPIRDQVITDDLIVNGGSLCVGVDCANGENFGSDTIRLSENNLRIHFDDTSTTASFPGNDWRLIANDQTNGGMNLFALEDSTAARRIAVFEAGAPANALYLDDAGNLGLGSATPAVEFQITDGDTPTVRLEQDGSSGFGAQIWDMAGNEANFFIRDVTNGSALAFRIQPGTDADTLILDNEGQVSIGKPGGIEADATLHVRARNVADNPVFLAQANDGTNLLTVATTGDMILAGTLAQLSRRDSKEHFAAVDHQHMLAALKGLDISTWNYKHQHSAERHLGPVAEEFYAAYGLGTDPEHIATSDMAAVALVSSQALLFELEAKDERIAELEDRLQRLEALMVQVLDKQQRSEQETQQIVNR